MLCRETCCDSSLGDLREEFHRAHILGVYRRSFHLLLDDHRLVTVFGNVRRPMPMSICTDATAEYPFAAAPLAEGMPAFFCDGILTIQEAAFWCSLGGDTIDLHRKSLPVPASFLELEAALLRHGKRTGAGEWLSQWVHWLKEGGELPGEALVLQRIVRLIFAADCDFRQLHKVLMESIGLGIGLTPSADDMICGMAAAAWLFWPEQRKRPFLEALHQFCAAKGEERTTLVSCQQLLLAAQGILSDPIFQLAEAVSMGREESIDVSMAELVQYGSSSGTELGMGLLAGVRMAESYGGKERNNQW